MRYNELLIVGKYTDSGRVAVRTHSEELAGYIRDELKGNSAGLLGTGRTGESRRLRPATGRHRFLAGIAAALSSRSKPTASPGDEGGCVP